MKTQIMLITSPLNEHSTLTLQPASAVILRLEAGDERTQINVVKKFAPLLQAQNTAVMVESTPEVAIRGGADGVHCHSFKAVKEASRHQPKFMVGAGGVFSKDEAMELGEAGVDYLYFQQNPKLSFENYLKYLEWWAQIFTIPAVGQALSLDEAKLIENTGIEFVGLMPELWGK